MKIHITHTTKQFLPEKVYKIDDRGMMDIPGKPRLKTYSVSGRYNKLSGLLEKLSYLNDKIGEVGKEKVGNPKWVGFNLD